MITTAELVAEQAEALGLGDGSLQRLQRRLAGWLRARAAELRPTWRACARCGGEQWVEGLGRRRCSRCRLEQPARAPYCPSRRQIARLKREQRRALVELAAELAAERSRRAAVPPELRPRKKSHVERSRRQLAAALGQTEGAE